MKPVFLICNAHLDPVWQWEWDEGMAEALSTYRIAADFCEQYDGFVFNHNEAMLYEWVEEYDPALFARIQSLVRQGKWHIMGGWYLQPDCNMPSGESILRQITVGRRYFREKFGAAPTVAVNFDSFGHSRGLVQLLAKTGYESYLFFRPPAVVAGLPAVDFCWVGYDGSRVKAHAANEGYNSLLGLAAAKIRTYVQDHEDGDRLLIPWGIGNHGGGPSRVDLETIAALKAELAQQGVELIHSTPEAYFDGVDVETLPRHEGDLNPSMVGCYTSQVLIKQKHRELEGQLLLTEKMAAAAELQRGCPIDWADIARAEKTLLFNEFHDILPGSSVERAMEASLRAFDCALELLNRQKVRAFMAFALRQPAAEPEELPVFVYNPHPYPVDRVVSCEFQLPDQNWSGTYIDYDAYQEGQPIPSQMEKEDSNIALDWRKRLTFRAHLAPFSLTRIRCYPRTMESRPPIRQAEGDVIRLENGDACLEISKTTGLIRAYAVHGKPLLASEAGRLLIVRDNADPWGMQVTAFPDVCGAFALADAATAGQIAGLAAPLEPVRIIEQGAVRTVVEAIFVYERSAAVVRYSFGAAGPEVGVHVRLQWMEPERMVKLALPSALAAPTCLGQVMFGSDRLRGDGSENVAQQWLAVTDGALALTVINTGSYASSFADGELRLTLLRSAAYCGHPIQDRDILPRDRFLPRIDIGERTFRFVLSGGAADERLDAVTREAQVENEEPYALSCFPAGGDDAGPCAVIDNAKVVLSCLQKHPDGWLMRLFNPTGQNQPVEIAVPPLGVQARVELAPYAVNAYLARETSLSETTLDGRPL